MFADCADKLAYGGLFDGWKDSPGPAGYPAPIPPPAPLYDVSQGALFILEENDGSEEAYNL